MLDLSLPEGAYFSVANSVRSQSGGQTRAILMRNRFFTLYGGVATTLLTFDDAPVYPTERERLAERGELVHGMELLNIFEHDREAALGPATGPLLEEPAGLERHDVEHPDGTVHVTRWRAGADEEDTLLDYRRADGSVYLRAPGPRALVGTRRWTLVGPDGRVVGSWARRAGWSQHWLRRLLGDRARAFVISDGRFAAQKVMPFADPRFHMIHLMHNVHVHGNRHWNAAISPNYTFVLDSISKFDGLVSLTHRQREDVAERYGSTNNLFTVSNPVVVPPAPDPLPARAAARFVMVSRFDRQKRIDQAVRVFARVAAVRPQARLDIYGVGETEAEVGALVEELGLTEQVRLLGWDPDAREGLWQATGFLLTSAHEGYPLATLESLSRGCPVLSYDIKYGPREQITDGVDGFLVADRDQQTMADRVVTMIDDPALVERMSAAARLKAQQHDHRDFLRQWQHVLTTVVAQKAGRARLDEVQLAVQELGAQPAGLIQRSARRLPGRLSTRLLQTRSVPAGFARDRTVALSARAELSGRWPKGALKKARFTLDAVSRVSEAVVRLPLTTRRDRQAFWLMALFPLSMCFDGRTTEDRSVTLRLRLVLGNESWEQMVERPVDLRPHFEISFDDRDRLCLRRD